eukprot:gnl/TRDRNA2_/TRDRNA2_137369_c0_seq1.p1 gnl/TRDRNA2_/TRDRNA2_137369_c0~~gnl/TRDRNA2_/TRDRNA2_137369_c0_seq1.p1  ORF type:complete len:891 (+),score=82.58 gnl/TRDRNA2_/TRDRNA2_137369_c0_seq1:322-2673(+)
MGGTTSSHCDAKALDLYLRQLVLHSGRTSSSVEVTAHGDVSMACSLSRDAVKPFGSGGDHLADSDALPGAETCGAEHWKTEGNKQFQLGIQAGNDRVTNQGRFKEALECYTRALDICTSKMEASALHSNCALVKIKLGDVEAALLHADKCIELRPEWFRGYQRKSDALRKLSEVDESRLNEVAAFECLCEYAKCLDGLEHKKGDWVVAKSDGPVSGLQRLLCGAELSKTIILESGVHFLQGVELPPNTRVRVVSLGKALLKSTPAQDIDEQTPWFLKPCLIEVWGAAFFYNIELEAPPHGQAAGLQVCLGGRATLEGCHIFAGYPTLPPVPCPATSVSALPIAASMIGSPVFCPPIGALGGRLCLLRCSIVMPPKDMMKPWHSGRGSVQGDIAKDEYQTPRMAGIVADKGHLTARFCTVRGFSDAGIEIRKGSEGFLAGTEIEDCGSGIKIYDDAECTLSNVKIFNTVNEGVLAGNEVLLAMDQCRIHHAGRWGVCLDHTATLVITNSVISGSLFYGIEVKGESSLQCYNSHIHGNKCGCVHQGINYEGLTVLMNCTFSDYSGSSHPVIAEPEHGLAFINCALAGLPRDKARQFAAVGGFILPRDRQTIFSHPPRLVGCRLFPAGCDPAWDRKCTYCAEYVWEGALICCSRCQCAKYCSRFCEKKDWLRHEPLCTVLSHGDTSVLIPLPTTHSKWPLKLVVLIISEGNNNDPHQHLSFCYMDCNRVFIAEDRKPCPAMFHFVVDAGIRVGTSTSKSAYLRAQHEPNAMHARIYFDARDSKECE